MTNSNANQTTDSQAGQPAGAQAIISELFMAETPDLPGDVLDEELLALMDLTGEPLVLDPPMLVPDLDVDRLVARQKEMMDTCFGGIGEETREEKRQGLAMQQLDIEQRHALRLLLGYEDPAELTTHLQRCLDEPAYGYGQRGDNGRTIAQALVAAAEGDLALEVQGWFDFYRDFQQAVLAGEPLSLRTLFDTTELDTFQAVVQRLGQTAWRLGVAGEGKHRDFEGPFLDIWPRLADAYVQWYEEDNARWLENLKRAATRLPDTIQRAAWADRLRKEQDRIEIENNRRVKLVTERDGQGWPRFITLGDQVGLARLSGHSFYELSWDGGLRTRRFEVSGTTRQRLPFEHIEIAVRLAEALLGEEGPRSDPTTPPEIEAAYLRRMKTSSASLGPPQPEPPAGATGKPTATYQAGEATVTLLHGTEDVAHAAIGQTAVLLRRNPQRGVIAALPLVRGRTRREPLMTTPLAEIEATAEANRALCAWAAWLAWALNK